MKKRICARLLSLLLAVVCVLIVCAAVGCGKQASDSSAVGEAKENADTSESEDAQETASATEKAMTKITLNEVAHSIFYAPMYVAIQAGYFTDEDIELDLVNGAGADNVMTALISGDADIGFMGSEASIYVYAEGMEDYVVNFAQLTQRAGNFLVAKEADGDFSWEKLKGQKVLGGRAGGMPEMVFEYILKQNGIDPSEVEIDQSVSFGNTAAAFMGSDEFAYTVEFEPFATTLETEGAGYIVASLGVDSGYVPYTAFCARKSFIEENPQLIQSFTNALQRGMDFVQTHTPEEIAVVIAPQFSETSEEALATIITRYYEQDTWKENLIFTEDAFDLLQDILTEAGELSEKTPYADLVTTEFAEAAASASD